MKSINKNTIVAVLLVVLFHVTVLITLLYSTVYYSWPPKNLPLPQQSEILFAGEYITIGNSTEQINNNYEDPASSQEQQPIPETKGEDLSNSEMIGEGDKIVATEQEDSPMEVEKSDPTNIGPTKSEIEEELRIKQQEQTAKKISSRVSFSSTGSDGGKEGTAKGNTDSKAAVRSGAPGHTLDGRTLEAWGEPSSNVDGTIVIEVRVNPRGSVIDARYKSGSGSAAASMSVRNSCVEESRKSRFSVSQNSTVEQIGTITWRFE
ncbi:MAG: hypothetical protein R3Y22_04510 [Bacteroidales bacterium]